MKKLLIASLFTLGLLAEEAPLPNLVHHFQIGPDVFWSHYRSGSSRSSSGNKFTTSLDGYYLGLRFGYDYFQPDALYAGTEAVVALGRDDIHTKNSVSRLASCSTCSRGSSHDHKTRLWANLEQRLGYNAQSPLFPSFRATPFLGIGWHDENTSSANAFWFYGTAGLKTMQKFYDRFELGIDFKFMYAFDIHEGGIVVITTTLGKKTFWGFEAALPLRWLIGTTNRWDFEFKPYILKLNLNSPQTILGANFLLGYSF